MFKLTLKLKEKKMPLRIKIYNSISKKKEAFEPINEKNIGMYVCGPTVYDSCHIGHARSTVAFDVMVRYFRKSGYNVKYVRNFTDIDDKIINRANKLNISITELSEKYIKEFYEDMDALRVLRADIEPKATEYMDEIINVVSVLIEKGFAYEKAGDVYFSVEAFDGYGKLSGRKLEDMKEKTKTRIDINIKKKNPLDFILWKGAKADEPFWESPWGVGRPGWHIECSAMSSKLIGESIDIHGGGKDLIFPHHENEIAQSEAAFGKRFVKYWVHNGFVNINKEKMSKSLGNFTTIKDILKHYHPEAVRLFLLSSRYRMPIDFNEQAMREAKLNLDKVYALFLRINIKNIKNISEEKQGKFWKKFAKAMDDDFNTSIAISVFLEAIRTANAILDENKNGIKNILSDIIQITKILGILYDNPKEYFEKQKTESLIKTGINNKEIEALIEERNLARKDKNFKKADEIRDKLDSMNIIIEDGQNGTTWKVKV